MTLGLDSASYLFLMKPVVPTVTCCLQTRDESTDKISVMSLFHGMRLVSWNRMPVGRTHDTLSVVLVPRPSHRARARTEVQNVFEEATIPIGILLVASCSKTFCYLVLKKKVFTGGEMRGGTNFEWNSVPPISPSEHSFSSSSLKRRRANHQVTI